MAYWHIQCHPDEPDKAIYYAKKALEKEVIGLDVGPEYTPEELYQKPLNEWSDDDFKHFKEALKQKSGKESFSETLKLFMEIKQGDIVLVRGGATPVALTEVVSNYFFNKNVDDKTIWFRHRYKVKILDWYEKWEKKDPERNKFTPPSQGTLGKLTSESKPTYRAIKKWLNDIEEEKSMDELIEILKQFKQIILTGAPGTGKTYTATEKIVKRMLEVNDLKEVEFPNSNDKGSYAIIQFHPSYSYEDLVQGIAPEPIDGGGIKYVVKKRIICKLAEEATKNSEKSYILIIDEINRANLPSVLGELIYALEYRDKGVNLTYSETDKMTLPKNLYIIGTMNTADRSIAHIDYAIRRRFIFYPLSANEEYIENSFGKKLFQGIQELFKRNLSPDFHCEDVMIGHSYFMGGKPEELAVKFVYQVLPLLKDYYKDGIITKGAKIEVEGIDPIDIEKHLDSKSLRILLEKVRQLYEGASDRARTEESSLSDTIDV
jgi:predicted CopG family antitoxin